MYPPGRIHVCNWTHCILKNILKKFDTNESRIAMHSSANSSLVLHSSYDAFTALMIADCISSFFFGDGAISIHYSTRHIFSVWVIILEKKMGLLIVAVTFYVIFCKRSWTFWTLPRNKVAHFPSRLWWRWENLYV